MKEFGLDLDDLSDIDLGDLGFDLDGADASGPAENRYILPKLHRGVKAHAVRYDRADEMAREIGPRILAGERVDALLSGNFIFGDLFEALAVSQNVLIEDLTLSTLSLGQENVDSLHQLLKRDYIKTLNIIVSDYFWSHNRRNAPYIFQKLDIADKFQFAVAGIHTKIALLRLGERKLIISGSANLRSSRCIEAITVETAPELYDFHMAWHLALIEKHATIRKGVRAGMAFDHILKNTEGQKEWQAS